MRHPDYPFWSFLSMLLVILPLHWHTRARNIATLSLIFWLFLANLVTFVNSLVWAGNYRDNNPVWCDISSRILLLLNYALPACSLSQMRRLESVASTRRSVISARYDRRRMIEEISICLVSPLLLAGLTYIVQGHRYNIVENIGCLASVYTSVPSMILRYAIPGAISVASLIFAVLAIRWFLIRRLQFQTILATSDNTLSVGRYLRLIALAVTDSTVLIAYAIYNASSTPDDPIQPYKSWKAVHVNFGQYSQYPEELFGKAYPSFVANAYAPFLYSIIFFSFFGFGEEAVNGYLVIASKVVKLVERFGLKRWQTKTSYEGQQFTLGSKVIPAGNDAASINERTNNPINIVDENITYKGKDTIRTECHGRGGVAVTVETSIV
ncbi:uncharacterized protein L201_002074 [Kwoniella dendrophila CBS 6074]|uniref:STE3 n=1 Tax=Kwoniella dendrophila CBS 6074 TaxID=1295534 RepID=A0AAX4JQP2_9TREE